MVALRNVDGERCEMKRLFVRSAVRGAGVGWSLVQRVIAEARARHYRRILLDTLPAMFGAQRLYERMGFKDIAPYYQSPVAGTRFLALDLDEIGKAGNEHV
jgi:ribosomal protein S18 acetylase RimI-like enzyme